MRTSTARTSRDSLIPHASSLELSLDRALRVAKRPDSSTPSTLPGMLGCNSFNSRLSALYSDNVRLDLGVHSPPPEPLGDRFSRDVGGFPEPRGVARLDLVS
jgi:hypothetical protein